MSGKGQKRSSRFSNTYSLRASLCAWRTQIKKPERPTAAPALNKRFNQTLQTLAHDPAKACPGLDPGWNRFADKIMRQMDKLARVPQISLRNLRKLDCVRKTGTHFC